jgi:hypothetical protein
MGLEETAVQERDGAEPAGSTTSLGDRTVERPEEERPQEVPVDRLPGGEATIDLFTEESLTARKPPLGLHEVEEEDTGKLKENEVSTVVGRGDSGQSRRHALEHRPELPEEPAADVFDRKRVRDSRRKCERAALGDAAHAAERGDGAWRRPIEVDGERRGALRPHRESQPSPGSIQPHHADDAASLR